MSGSALPWIEGELSCVPGPSAADPSGMFSGQSLVYGAWESESWFLPVWNPSSLKHEASRQPCGLPEHFPFLNLGSTFVSFYFFLSFPISSKASTPCLLPPRQPCLLESSFSERVPHSLELLTRFERGDVTTRGCASLFKCTEFEVLYASVSKHTCFWSQRINMIYFQF